MYNRGGDKMKMYDTHSDIMFNLYNRTINGEKDVFTKYHLDDLKKGGIVGGIWVVYSETDFDIQRAYDIAINAFKPYEKEFDVLYGLEGLRNVKNIDELKDVVADISAKVEGIQTTLDENAKGGCKNGAVLVLEIAGAATLLALVLRKRH